VSCPSKPVCNAQLTIFSLQMLFKRRSETASDPSPPSYAVEWSLGQFRNPTAFGTTAARTRSKAIFNRFTNVGVDDPDADVALVSLFFSLRDEVALLTPTRLRPLQILRPLHFKNRFSVRPLRNPDSDPFEIREILCLVLSTP